MDLLPHNVPARVLFGLLALSDVQAKPDGGLEEWQTSRLEQRLGEIDSALERLSSYSLRSGTGAVGYQSRSHIRPENPEWIRIEFGSEWPIDQIVLVPTIRRDPETGLGAEAFPVDFRILAGTGQTTHVVATFTAEDRLLPRIAPLVISFPSVSASWVGVEATRLSARGWDHRYALQFSEFMAFSGMENVALNKAVSASSSDRTNDARDERFLVDGLVPYLMDSAQGAKSQAIIFRTNDSTQALTLAIDLQESLPINQINLHTVESSHTIPEAVPGDHAVPHRLRVTGSNRPDFSDQVVLFEYEQSSIYDVGPIICRRFPETSCRYLRLELMDFPPRRAAAGKRFAAGFAEIEVYSRGENVALGKPVTASGIFRPNSGLERLTDGQNYWGQILPLRSWMNQLASRHDLETERPQIAAGLRRHYSRQKANLHLMSWLAGSLAIGIFVVVILEQVIHRNAIRKVRGRIAADLHDEVGANLHAIGMFASLAREEAGASGCLKEIADRIRALTDRTTAAVRDCSNMLESSNICEDLAAEMRRSCSRLLADMHHDITFQGEEFLRRLSPRKRMDLFLFYKECLTNILRHAKATHVSIRLTATPLQLKLVVADNRIGQCEAVPASLKRRARMFGARVSSSSSESGSTEIVLTRKHKKMEIFK